MTEPMPAPGGSRDDVRRVFSTRLEAFLEQIQEGETVNYGSFCSFCYNPLPPAFDRCDHCGQVLSEHSPVQSLPDEVILMHRRKHKRENLVVNSFAFFGLGLGLALFLGMVAINVLYLDKALWFFVLATIVLMIGSRVLAGIIGGYIGDEVGYRYGNKRLAEDWAAYVSQRQKDLIP